MSTILTQDTFTREHFFTYEFPDTSVKTIGDIIIDLGFNPDFFFGKSISVFLDPVSFGQTVDNPVLAGSSKQINQFYGYISVPVDPEHQYIDINTNPCFWYDGQQWTFTPSVSGVKIKIYISSM